MTDHPDVVGYAADRGITEVLHFTTQRGLIGILHHSAVVSRDRLDTDPQLDDIKVPNCFTRSKDAAWTGYVNLSISRVNKDMLNTSRGWHENEEVWWAVLAFDVQMLGDAGVYFTTTNNTYAATVRRGTGLAGLQAMFAPTVPFGYYGSVHTRRGLSDSHTTDLHAEVLYPDEVPLAWLRGIYVPEPEHIDEIAGWVANFPHVPVVPVTCRPEIFW